MTTDADDLLTLQEAADQLKVHYMTAYRWVRRGELEAFKTGGRLRVPREALQRYLTTRKVQTGVQTELTADHEGRRDWSMHVERLVDALLQGEDAEAQSLVRKVLSDGASAGDIYVNLLTPALHCVGDQWAEGDIGVAAEHRATQIITGIMHRLADHFRKRGPNRGVAITMAAPGDEHALASAMLADFLRGSSWNVHHLGGNLSASDLGFFVDLVPADIICISVGHPLDAEGYADLRRAAGHGQVLMGGRAVDTELATQHDFLVLEDFYDLVAYLDRTF